MGSAVIFGLQTWLQVRRTGSSGSHGISGEPGSLRWWAGVSLVAGLVIGLLRWSSPSSTSCLARADR